VAAEAHPPATRAPAKAAIANMDVNRVVRMTSLPFLNDGPGADAGRRSA
jgi:hypothetical protein